MQFDYTSVAFKPTESVKREDQSIIVAQYLGSI